MHQISSRAWNLRAKPHLAVGMLLLALYSGTAACGDVVPRSKWGVGDEIGNANLLQPALARQAASLVTQGKVYSLAMTVDEKANLNPDRVFSLKLHRIDDLEANGTAIDDTLQMSLGIGTQIDGFAHFGIGGVHYNGFKVDDFFREDGVTKLGVDKIPPMVTRGVLLDMRSVLDAKALQNGAAFGKEELERAESLQGTPIQPGDVVLIHTGWLQRWQEGQLGRSPGLSGEAAEYLASKSVIAVGADLPALDTGSPFAAHRVLLVRNGIYILEYVKTQDLAADRTHEFMFVLGRPQVKGAVQISISPVAIR